MPRCTSLIATAMLACGLGLAASTVHAENRPVGLSEAFAMALDNDPQLAAVQRRYDAEGYSRDEVAGGLLPQITADANYAFSRYERNVAERNPQTLRTEQFLEMQEQNSYTWGISLNQVIYDRELFRRIDFADSRIKLAQSEVELERNAVAERVAEAYFEVLLSKQNLKLAESQIKAFQARFDQQTDWLEKGLTTRADMLDAKVRLEQAQAAKIKAENNLQTAILRLERLTGADLGGRVKGFTPDEVARIPLEHDSEYWVNIARQNNPQVRIAERNVDVARSEVEISRARHWPTVNLQARYSDTNALDQVIGGEDKRIFLRAQVPIYQGGSLRASTKSADANRMGRMEELRNAQRQAELTVRETLNTYFSAQDQARALINSLQTAEAYLEAAEQSYRLGLRDLVELLDARARVFEIERDLAQAVFEEVISLVRLYSATGRLDENTLIELDKHLKLVNNH